MDLNGLTDKDYLAIISSIAGGLLRILLNVDPDIPKPKQFLLLFFAALPVGWSAYLIAISYDYNVFAFPAGFFSGIMALSIVTIIARDGAKALFVFFEKIGRGGK